MFSRAKQGLLAIGGRAKHGSEQEKKVARNVMSSLALTLQELSTNFRNSQSNYLRRKSLASISLLLSPSPIYLHLSIYLSIYLSTYLSNLTI